MILNFNFVSVQLAWKSFGKKICMHSVSWKPKHCMARSMGHSIEFPDSVITKFWNNLQHWWVVLSVFNISIDCQETKIMEKMILRLTMTIVQTLNLRSGFYNALLQGFCSYNMQQFPLEYNSYIILDRMRWEIFKFHICIWCLCKN